MAIQLKINLGFILKKKEKKKGGSCNKGVGYRWDKLGALKLIKETPNVSALVFLFSM